jgi:hypothetical protein
MGASKRLKTISILENTVIKTNRPIRARIEAEKTIRAFEIGKSSGLFRVPRVLDYDDSKGIIVLERLKNITKLGPVLCSGAGGRKIVETIADSLSIIHSNLCLPDEMRVPLPEELSFPGDDVYLHGDFSIKNVFVTTDRPGIAILDWQTTWVHEANATYGTRYFDVMFFLSSIFGLMWQWNNMLSQAKHATPTARKFINRYCQSAHIPEDNEIILTYLKKFFSYRLVLWKQKDKWVNHLINQPRYSYIKRIIESPELILKS